VVGTESKQAGFHVVGAHIDSPRLDLKGRPLFEKNEFALFQTNYHGGIKFHQWTNLPLALVGRIDKKDGSSVSVSVGLNPDEPIFMIPELSPHVDRSRKSKTLEDFIGPEDLDPVIAHIPSTKESTKETTKDIKEADTTEAGDVVDQVLKYLQAEYGATRADLVSAELSLVPAGAPRDMGFDRGLIAAYGQDDRLASYAALRAIADIDNPEKTTVAYLVDNEEVGNRNNTGAKSDYFADLLSRMLYAELGESYREPLFRSALRQTKFISIDVNPGVNPMNPDAWELGNAPKLGYGVNLKLYGQGNTANSEFIAWTRKLLDDNQVPWQTVTYKVGSAGGGTIGGEFSRQNIEVIDFGVPLLSIHTPYAVSSKIDVYSLYRAAKAFYGYKQ
jgi:aspartyl aminopeptidase